MESLLPSPQETLIRNMGDYMFDKARAIVCLCVCMCVAGADMYSYPHPVFNAVGAGGWRRGTCVDTPYPTRIPFPFRLKLRH
jgi:hypothetical protein